MQETASALKILFRKEVERRGRVFQESPKIDEAILKTADWLVNQPTTGLYLKGLPGNGKTTLMRTVYALFRHLNATNQRVFDTYTNPVSVQWCTAVDIAKAFQRDEKNKTNEFDKICRFPSILAIDDLGQEPKEILSYGNVVNPLIELFSVRYDRRLFTICTTNLTTEQVKIKYEDRIADRFKEMMTSITFDEPTYRNKQKL